mmetsp:Transcript_16207/g.53363  ORF Transcript_16207/g.53363 Transcript_16207/m.53363 type:complete len:209 (+) Transcript_16207:899-1525(+)
MGRDVARYDEVWRGGGHACAASHRLRQQPPHARSEEQHQPADRHEGSAPAEPRPQQAGEELTRHAAETHRQAQPSRLGRPLARLEDVANERVCDGQSTAEANAGQRPRGKQLPEGACERRAQTAEAAEEEEEGEQVDPPGRAVGRGADEQCGGRTDEEERSSQQATELLVLLLRSECEFLRARREVGREQVLVRLDEGGREQQPCDSC